MGLKQVKTSKLKTMRDERVGYKASQEEKQLLRKAAHRLHVETGQKPNISKAIRASVKEFADKPPVTNEPEIFMIDRQSIRQVQGNIEHGLTNLNKFYKEFSALTGTLLTFDELKNCFEGLSKFGSETIWQRDIKQMVTQKLFQRLEKNNPDLTVTTDNLKIPDLTSLFEIALNLDNMPEVQNRLLGLVWSCYQLSENKIVVIAEEVERLKNFHRKAASTPEQKKRLAKVRELCAVLNSFLDDKEAVPENLTQVFYFDKESARFEPSGSYVITSLRPNILFTKY
jgi:hypothetical protein